MAQVPRVPFGSVRMFISSVFSYGKSSTGLTTRKILEHTFLHGRAQNRNNSPGMWICTEAVFYFWSSTGRFPRPPWHNYFNMGGKHVSTVTADFSALFAVHSLTTVSLLEGFLPCCHLILGPLSEHAVEKSKQILCFAEQIPFTRWSPQISQGKK